MSELFDDFEYHVDVDLTGHIRKVCESLISNISFEYSGNLGDHFLRNEKGERAYEGVPGIAANSPEGSDGDIDWGFVPETLRIIDVESVVLEGAQHYKDNADDYGVTANELLESQATFFDGIAEKIRSKKTADIGGSHE